MRQALENVQKECITAFREFTQASFQFAETVSNKEEKSMLPNWLETKKQFENAARKCISLQDQRNE